MTDSALESEARPVRVGGRYTLRGELGRGGMATVHRAHDEALDRDVAVKLLHPHLATDPAFLDRFRREARAAAALSHPNVVAVHDWGETDEGAFLVLQLIEGVSLRDVLRDRGSLSPAEAAAVLAPASAGLGAAHAAGFVHRDVKPENLLIGVDGTVRVTDFGLARAAASATTTFGAEVLVGSPHYLSPEAVDGRALDARADVYALGVVLFECLVGSPPHDGESPLATAVAHTARAVPPPSTVRADLPDVLDALVVRATSISPERRHPDASAFGDALRRLVPAIGAPPMALSIPGHHDVHGDDGPAGPAERSGPTVSAGGTLVVDRGTTPTTVTRRPPTGRLPAAPSVAPPPGPPTTPTAARDTGQVPAGATKPARARPTATRSTSRRWPWVLLVLAALLAASATGGYLLWDQVLAPVSPVPGVLGAPQAAAVEQLGRAGFEVSVADDRLHDLDVPTGHVIDQRPSDEARRGSVVTLVLSAGPRPVEVPEVAGRTLEEARALLDAVGLGIDPAEAHDEEVPAGTLLEQSPGPLSVVDEGSAVAVVVSLGREPIPVPELLGTTEGEARQLAQAAGLRLEVAERRHAAEPAGVVIAQDPSDGQLFRSDPVRVTVSEGPEPVAVPNVRGQRAGQAVAELEALGFVVQIERQGGLGALLNPDRVHDQDPAPGTRRPPGSTVVVYAYN